MTNLLINRVKFNLESPPQIRISRHNDLLFQKKASFFISKFKGDTLETFQSWRLENQVDEEGILSFDFAVVGGNDEQLTMISEKYFYPHYVKSVLLRYFENTDMLIEEYPEIYDLCIYEKIGAHNQSWDIFRRYDIAIKSGFQEVSFNIGSNRTLISKMPYETEHLNMRGVTTGKKVVRLSRIPNPPARVIANKKTREELHIKNTPKPVSYKDIHKQLSIFFEEHLRNVSDGNLTFLGTGLINVNLKDLKKVNISDNKMQFGNSRADISAITGMRDFGAYELAPSAVDNKFIFIYEDSDDANKLFQYLKNGLKHFTGLERYVGIPVRSDREKSLKYSNIQSLKGEFDNFLESKLPNHSYKNYFAVVIGHFDKEEADERESELYYYIKGKFLGKEIPSQFIDYKSIRNNSAFHFYLPNIAIAMLAKIGGIPWRLRNKHYEELIVGFNQVKISNESYVGSAVFFSNDGRLNSVSAFPQSNSTKAIISHLRESINKYLEENRIYPKHLVIHYYKPQSKAEKEKIENLLYKELGVGIPFAIIEINDSKTHSDICFDIDYEMGMPESGTYVRIGRKEYILFNNTRYEKKPLRAINEELPIKVKIHFTTEGEFLDEDLIGQVYEFSRLYWKSLKQRSQPVTTIYSKLIAEFSAHSDGILPNNKLTNTTPWFL